MLLAYNITEGRAVHVQSVVPMLSGARRSACCETLKLSDNLPAYMDKWHTWIAFISDNRESISNSKYLGPVEINILGTKE